VTPRRGVFASALAHAIGFFAVAGVAYGFFSLMGHSLYSAAYKARANSELRTKAAQEDVLEIGRQVSALVSTESLDRFARMHGFDRPGALVAMNNASSNETRVR
jgi:hypothetical protein